MRFAVAAVDLSSSSAIDSCIGPIQTMAVSLRHSLTESLTSTMLRVLDQVRTTEALVHRSIRPFASLRGCRRLGEQCNSFCSSRFFCLVMEVTALVFCSLLSYRVEFDLTEHHTV